MKAYHVCGAMVLFCIATLPAGAGVMPFATAVGATASDGQPVHITATFTTSAGHVQVTLKNLIANPKAVSQNVSGVLFTLNPGQTTGSVSASPNVTVRTVASDGSFADTTGASGWVLTTSGSSPYFTAINLNGNTTPWPAHTLIGQPDPNQTTEYTNANNSIAGNGPHNPFVYGPLTATFDFAGVADTSTISNVVFTIGTGSDSVAGYAVPEPAALLLLGVGAACLIFGRAPTRHSR